MNTELLSRRRLMQMLTSSMIGSGFALNAAASGQHSLTETADPSPVFIPPGAGKKGKIGASDIIFKLDKTQTSGNLGSSELVLPSGIIGAPPHHHKNFDEICIVQEGAVNIWVEGEVIEVKAGGWHLRPRGLMHTFWNSGTSPAKLYRIISSRGS